MVFFSDINLYDNSGALVVSSRPEIFSRGLQSRLINPKAYTEIEKEHKLFYLGKEKIQNVEFYSSYAPFILSNGTEIGIINLPYFARQSELQHTYYQMLANLINLFVITGLLGMLLMVYLSRLLTRPLNILQRKITSVSIEKQNEKIEWNRNDEIGKLIEAYNQMVEKLEESARLMKYSAREKAWREMARQIAHEIRNPLTPMKLNVQYLQKVYSAKDPSFDEKFKSVSRSLINQIDTMNDVAGMFADFSKIKMPVDEKANLMEAINSTCTLFRKSYKLNIVVDTESNNIEVKTSMQDLLRIFNNLLKNAVQSMEKTSDKSIRIQILQRSEYVEVHVTDNGKGINEADKEHIFQPYFTTKSKGTGLGLAIVKNLMTEMGGEIIFVSGKGLGTTFILKFPYSVM
jgi:nitrogen fixation/metabolism regulation signal transduction histidine kinase